MKKIINILVICLIISTLNAKKLKNKNNSRESIAVETISSGNITAQISNFSTIGNPVSDQNAALSWPRNSENSYIWYSSIWLGAKKYRRDDNGQIYYWLPNAYFSNDIIVADDELWTPELQPVLDRLTTTGFEGDKEYYELLPAYNHLENPLHEYMAFTYNDYDIPYKKVGNLSGINNDEDSMVDEDEIGTPLIFPDPANIYCFNLPNDCDGDGLEDEDSALVGFQNVRVITYDYSPFGFDIDRDVCIEGVSQDHIPLEVAIKQEYYTWPVEEFSNCLIISNTIYNTSQTDTLFDFTYGYIVDPDINQHCNYFTGDDVTRFNTEHQFAYSYDTDDDSFETPGMLGCKILYPDNLVNESWSWDSGDGPDDRYQQETIICNEKYEIMTSSDYECFDDVTSLKNNPDYQINDPFDTRFTYSVHGDMQGYENATANSLNLVPGEEFQFYTILFLGYTEEELESTLIAAEEFINSGFDSSYFDGKKSIPYLAEDVKITDATSAKLEWAIATNPDNMTLAYKEKYASSNDWQEFVLSSLAGNYNISDLSTNTEYVAKITADFAGIILESNIVEFTPTLTNIDEELEDEFQRVYNYPNPFKSFTTFSFSPIVSGENAKIEIFNIKGQKLKTFSVEQFQAGTKTIVWDRTDDNNHVLSTGVYLYKMTRGNSSVTQKMLILK